MAGGARRRLNRVYSLHLNTSSLARSSPRLSEAMLQAASAITAAHAILDEAALARLVRESSEDEWGKVLSSVADAVDRARMDNKETVGEFR